MKHVIIAGTCRSGKTTLSIKLAKDGYMHYKMDSIKRSICDIIGVDGHNWPLMSYMIYNMINRMIDENKSDMVFNCERYVIDTCHLLPPDALKIQNDIVIIYLGYANITKKEYFKIMRKYDLENYWSYHLKDFELLKMIEDNINYSKYICKECNRLGIPYFDTSIDRESVLNEAYQYIKNKS